MANSEPFLRPSHGQGCYICGVDIVMRSSLSSNKSVSFKKDLTTIKEYAEKWRKFDVPETDQFYCFTGASYRMINKTDGYFHVNCVTNFRTKRRKYNEKAIATAEPTVPNEIDATSLNTSSDRCTRSSLSAPTEKHHCFICNQYTGEETFRISQESVSEKVSTAKSIHLTEPNGMYYAASNRLDLMLQGSVVDIFAADIFYHKSCLGFFTYIRKNNEPDPAVDFVRDHFLNFITLKICKQKNAYLLHELLNDSIDLSADYDVESIFSCTKSLRRYLEDNVDNLGFHKLGRHVVVYPSDVDPIMYSESTLNGHGLRKNDIIRSFARIIHRVADDYADYDHIEWPATVDELIAGYGSDKPIAELYNAIYMTLNRQWTSSVALNEHGFAKVESKNIATKIWSIASDWTALITGLKNSKQITLALDVTRLTANKEVATLLWKAGHMISPNDVRIQNEEFLLSQSEMGGVLSGLIKGAVTHSSLDNNDMCQDTSTGKNTTHHTNFLLFQPDPPTVGEPITSTTNKNTNASETNSTYKIGRLVPPPIIPDYEDKECSDLVEISFQEDFLWALAGGVPSDNDDPLPLLGSWTAYKKNTSEKETPRSLLNYLPANENPPEHGVCKEYLEYVLEVMECLDIKRIFVHADEQVYARIVQLIWKHKDKFKNIIPLMGGFHQLRVFQKILYKRHAVVGYGDWYWDSAVIAEGSAPQAIEGRHYYRSMRVHKEGFDALSQYRLEEMTDGYKNIDQYLLEELKKLRRNPSRSKVEYIMHSIEFQTVYSQFITVTDSRSCMTMQYLKDVSLMLCIVSAVREGCFERHLQAERQFLKLVFAFDHINYARYNSYQHIFLTNMKNTGNEAISDLITYGFGCTTSDRARFASKHGDLETEHFNRETKGTAGPFRSGYSTDMHAVNRWIKTSHCHAKIRKAVKNQFRIFTSSVHKELTPKNKRLHHDHVSALKKKLRDYNAEPFKPGPARNIVTGKEIDVTVVNGLLSAPEKGDKQYKTFTQNVFVTGTKKIFDTISKNKINTGIEVKRKKCKKIDVLQEDKQVFGLIISKCESKEEGFAFPMTYYPLSIAKTEQYLYSADKSKFRNEIIGESFTYQANPDAVWIIDAGYAIRQVNPRNTYKEYYSDLLDWMIPDPNNRPRSVIIGVDDYRDQSTKDGERNERRGGKEEGKRVHVSGLDQMMPKGKVKWSDFLSNGKNKNDLMRCFELYIKTDEARKKVNGLEIIFCGRESIWSIKENVIKEHGLCNHEEADTKVPLYASQSNSNVVAVAQDCDVLVLLVTVYANVRPEWEWQFMYETSKFANINNICKTLGYDVSKYLIHYHAISGCDTTSYFFGKGKITPFQKAVNSGRLSLLSGLGEDVEISMEKVDSCKEFIRCVMYQGKPGETYLQTRINLYDMQPAKSKTTVTIPPDEDSCTQHILRCHHRVFSWKRCRETIIPPIDMLANGWKLSEDGMVVPAWYVGPQLPPSCNKTTRKNSRGKTDGYEADIEADKEQKQKSKRKRRTVTTIEEDEDEEKRQKLEKEEKGRLFRCNAQRIANDGNNTNDTGNEATTVENDGSNEEEDDYELCEQSDDWEHYSEFNSEFNSDSSGSDWM